MTITYHSTRSADVCYTASQAILSGIAPDGGLFVPSTFPSLDLNWRELPFLSYEELAYVVMKDFLGDFSEAELRACVSVYNSRFDSPRVAPLIQKGDLHYLELFHGPTLAFKDMALSVLPQLMTVSAKKNHLERELVILTATSGDTGKAALVGFADVLQTKIIVFYPKNGVSEIQEKQMLTQKGNNVSVVAIEGNFDDAQTQVKEMFSDPILAAKLSAANKQLSSANSINIGRLVPQIVYYVYAYGQLIRSGALQPGDPMNVAVPTGNFGNILAAYYAQKMGLPINKLITASNENHVLVDFFHTGIYDRNRDFILTSSPSMDILVSSNLERLLYLLTDGNTDQVKKYMTQLSTSGTYQVDAKWLEKAADFHAGFAREEQVNQEIANVYQQTGYTLDPHTAVASFVARKYQQERNDHTPLVVASTASPYKFPEAVLNAVSPQADNRSLEEALSEVKKQTEIPYPAAIEEALHAPVLHNQVVPTSRMKAEVEERLSV